MHRQVDALHSKLKKSLTRAGRGADACQFIAVSKTKPIEQIDAARAAGVRHFGENKVQEAQEKFPERAARNPDESLHLIGPLQTNKARAAIHHFDFIHSLDRPKLVDTLARLADEIGFCPQLFIQVNTGEEPQKAGVLPDRLEALVAQARHLTLPLIGLMCIPPVGQAPAPHFAWLAQRAHDLGLDDLSMGMSHDFEAAAELGATYVRVGSALFGGRP